MQLENELIQIKNERALTLTAEIIQKINEGVVQKLPIAGYLVANFNLLTRLPGIDSDVLLNLAREYVVNEIKTHGLKKLPKAREIEQYLNTVHDFCEKLTRRTTLAAYTSAMLNFAEYGLPTKYIATPLDSTFKESPFNFIAMMVLDDILSFSEKMQILGYFDGNYSSFGDTILNIQGPCRELIYQYFLDKAQKLVLKNNLLEAIEVLRKIPKGTAQYVSACYAISLHQRTLYEKYRAQIVLKVPPNRFDKFIVRVSKNLLKDADAHDEHESSYKEVFSHLQSASQGAFLTGESDIPKNAPQSEVSAAELVEANSLSIEFSKGQPRAASLAKKTAIFSAITATTTKCLQSYLLTRRHFNTSFSVNFSYAGKDLRTCSFDQSIQRRQPTQFGPSIMPTFMFSVLYFVPLAMAFQFAYRYGVTHEKKYIAFAIAAMTVAIGLSLTDQMINDWWQTPTAEAEGYNWRWTTAKSRGCPEIYSYDNGHYLKALHLTQEYHDDLAGTVFQHLDSPILAFIFRTIFSQSNIQLALLVLAGMSIIFGVKAGQDVPKAEIVIDNQRSVFELR